MIRKRRTSRRGPTRDVKYLNWIRSFMCLVCRNSPLPQSSRTEAAHVGERGLGQKCSDRETIPLCALHHRIGPESHHVLGKGFWQHHGINKSKTINTLNALYDLLDHSEVA